MEEALIDFGWVMLGFACGIVFMLMVLRRRPHMYEDGYDDEPQVLREGYRPKRSGKGPGKPPQGGSGALRPPPQRSTGRSGTLRSPPNTGAPRPEPPRPLPATAEEIQKIADSVDDRVPNRFYPKPPDPPGLSPLPPREVLE